MLGDAVAKIRGARNRLRKMLPDPHPWGDAKSGFRSRSFASYGAYQRRQARKSRRMSVAAMVTADARTFETTAERIADLNVRGKSVLCLGARAGGEVRAFARAGAFAVGIDLNPIRKTKLPWSGYPLETGLWVLVGDFQHIQWLDSTVDIVFTNSLDHAYQLDGVLAEIRRVLKPDGMFAVDIVAGTAEGMQPGDYEAVWWDTIRDVAVVIESAGFVEMSHIAFDQPWPGTHFRYQLSP